MSHNSEEANCFPYNFYDSLNTCQIFIYVRFINFNSHPCIGVPRHTHVSPWLILHILVLLALESFSMFGAIYQCDVIAPYHACWCSYRKLNSLTPHDWLFPTYLCCYKLLWRTWVYDWNLYLSYIYDSHLFHDVYHCNIYLEYKAKSLLFNVTWSFSMGVYTN